VFWSTIEDPQVELLITDVLLTDYSGITFDFALTNKPIAIFAPDEKSYVNQRSGYNFNLNEIYNNCSFLALSDLDGFWSMCESQQTHHKMLELHTLGSNKRIYDYFESMVR
jgi:CDP-glycerol glycerophosphotransferase (TagB/SpsB family)